jgi:hypothetical protein
MNARSFLALARDGRRETRASRRAIAIMLLKRREELRRGRGRTDGRMPEDQRLTLDIYGWNDLGHHTAAVPARGCAGFYMLSERSAPENAS